MGSDEITVHLLGEIRDELRGVNTRVDRLEKRVESGLASLESKLEQGLDGVRHEILEVEIRNATRTTEMIATFRRTNEMLAEQGDMRDRMLRCEIDIADLKRSRSGA